MDRVQSRVQYWFMILYAFGSYLVRKYRLPNDSVETRVFCGYWVLYALGSIKDPSEPSWGAHLEMG
jgi:hypothetical protein